MKGHLCPRVSPVLDGRGDRPKKRSGLSGLFVQVILCLLMSSAAINSSSARRGLIMMNWTEGFQGAGYWLNTKQGEQSLQDHTAEEPRGAPCFLNPCHYEAPGPETSVKIISGHEPCSIFD